MKGKKNTDQINVGVIPPYTMPGMSEDIFM